MQNKHAFVADGNTYVVVKGVYCLTSHDIGNQTSVPKAEPQYIRKQEYSNINKNRHQVPQRLHVISKVG